MCDTKTKILKVDLTDEVVRGAIVTHKSQLLYPNPAAYKILITTGSCKNNNEVDLI